MGQEEIVIKKLLIVFGAAFLVVLGVRVNRKRIQNGKAGLLYDKEVWGGEGVRVIPILPRLKDKVY
ncbi:MAG: hypothetical protein ACREGC_00640 [Minisyncoccia bacterium]